MDAADLFRDCLGGGDHRDVWSFREEREMIEQAKYEVRGYLNEDEIERGYDDVQHADTLKEAKQRAWHLLSEDIQRVLIVQVKTNEVMEDIVK
jgi:hypothetical protein